MLTPHSVEAMPRVDVFIHTDGPWTGPPPDSTYRARAFWSGRLQNLSATRQRWDCCWRAPANVESVYKYKAFLSVSSQSRQSHSSWVGVLADSDTLFQCSSDEFRSTFHRFGVPLVVSGERRWYPIPRNYPDPFGPLSNMSWKERYDLRHRHQFYPNSGLIAGTSTGFEALASAVQSTPRFPCCAFQGDKAGFALDPCSSCRPIRRFPDPVSCTVEDQACLQVALASRSHSPPHAIDSNAELFLNLNELTPSDLAITDDGRIAFRHTGAVPCVLHSNGHKGILRYLAPQIRAQARWAVMPGSKASGADADRATWQNGVWRRFRLKHAAARDNKHEQGRHRTGVYREKDPSVTHAVTGSS